MNNCIRPPHFPPHCGCPVGMIRADVNGKITMSNGKDVNEPVEAFFEYDPTSPLVVGILFEWEDDESYWMVGRDLLIECFKEGFSGGGDIILVDLGDKVGVILCTEEGNAVIQLEAKGIQAFVDETVKAVPVGEEDMSEQIDEFIAEVLSS